MICPFLYVLCLQTYTNAEVIAIDRDHLGRAAQRLVGGALLGGGGTPPLHGPAVTLAPCGSVAPALQVWSFNASGTDWFATP